MDIKNKKRRSEKPYSAVRSYGIIAYVEDKVLLVQRKDSFGYITCIDNGTINQRDIAETLSTITKDEKEKLLTWNWDQLWADIGLQNRTEYKKQCEARFEWMGIRETIQSLDQRGEKWRDENEWGLPKGRMSSIDNENTQRCAQRELKEETGLTVLCDHRLGAFNDEFIGTDGKHYSTTYYVGRIQKMDTLSNQPREIRQIQLCSVEQCRQRLRPTTADLIHLVFEKLNETNNKSDD